MIRWVFDSINLFANKYAAKAPLVVPDAGVSLTPNDGQKSRIFITFKFWLFDFFSHY